jgi:hypothetical protein
LPSGAAFDYADCIAQITFLITLRCTSRGPRSGLIVTCFAAPRPDPYPSAESRLPESLHFAESDVIVGVVRVRSVHKVVYGHNGDWAAA